MSTEKQKLTGKALRDAILALDDRPLEPIDIPEWPFYLYLRPMSGTQRDRLEAKMAKEQKDGDARDVRAYIAQMTLVDPDGQHPFSVEDIEALGEKSCKALNRVFTKVLEINGFGAGDVEKLEKN